MLLLGVVALVLTAALCATLVSWRRLSLDLRSERQAVEKARTSIRVMERELAAVRREISGLEDDHRIQGRFIRESIELLSQLHSRASTREIPRVLINIMLRTFEPEQAVVLVRSVEGGREGASLVVAGVHPATSPIPLGLAVPSNRGKLAYVADMQRVMSSEDFDRSSFKDLRHTERELLPGFPIDLAAPMVFEERAVGVLALGNPARQPAAAREVLRLIAQLGALAYYNSHLYTQVQRHAEIDQLTRIANKASILRILESELRQADRRRYPLSIVLFDIDHFKNYNDLNGHLAGDLLLASLARIVGGIVRDYDHFGRFGGEEFLLVLPETSAVEALQVAEKIRQRIAEEPFDHSASQPLGRVSISGGIATYPGDGVEAEALLQQADTGLYRAKDLGRDRIAVASELVSPARGLSRWPS